jgi:hypothetical protein
MPRAACFCKEYAHTGQVSQRTDSYAFGIVLLELLTGACPAQAVKIHAAHHETVATAIGLYKDPRAGKWQMAVLRAIATAADQCLVVHAKSRAYVHDVLPTLEAIEAATEATRLQLY